MFDFLGPDNSVLRIVRRTVLPCKHGITVLSSVTAAADVLLL
jgi:hypothetical protein